MENKPLFGGARTVHWNHMIALGVCKMPLLVATCSHPSKKMPVTRAEIIQLPMWQTQYCSKPPMFDGIHFLAKTAGELPISKIILYHCPYPSCHKPPSSGSSTPFSTNDPPQGHSLCSNCPGASTETRPEREQSTRFRTPYSTRASRG